MKLKYLRIIFSAIILVLFLLIFLFSYKITIPVGKAITSTQFVPTLLRLFFSGISVTAIGFMLIILLTLLLGRVYCSFLCPLGIFQDVIIFFSKFFKKKHSYIKPYEWFKFTILISTIIITITGSLFLINLLDPYTIFSRITTNLFRPLSDKILNSIVFIFRSAGIYLPIDIQTHKIEIPLFMISIFSVIIVSGLAVLKGRLYCNTICPVGTCLGMISKFSFFNVVIDNTKCTSCGKCETVCKAGCINSKEKSIDVSRCVSCYNCLDTCKFDALSYKFRFSFNKEKEIDFSKRKLLKSTPALLTGAALLISIPGRIFSKNKIFSSINKNSNLITPPGSVSLKHFTDACVSCHLCVKTCPSKVLRPAYAEYGLTGLFQPKMDYNEAFCDYECNDCSIVCPTGAIRPLKLEEKKVTQIGWINLKKEHCIVYNNHTDCGACAEHCPTLAVFTIPYDGLFAPVTNTELCIGCGACEHVCPARPVKAISIISNNIHKKAKLSPELKNDAKVKESIDEEFPF